MNKNIVQLIALFILSFSTILYGHVKVSIITPFARNDSITDFLNQVSEEEYSNCEIVLISSDFSQQQIATIKQYQYLIRTLTYITDETKTVAALFNQAIQAASGKFITYMRIEDYRPAALYNAQIHELETNNTIDIAYGDYYISYDRNKRTQQADKWYLSDLPEFSPHLLYRDIPGYHTMWRKSLHEKYGYFNEEFKFHFFWDFWNRCGAHNVLFKKITGNPGTYYFNYFNQKKLMFGSADYEKSYQEEKYICDRYSYLWDLKEVQKAFVIITASYKNKDWYKWNLDLLLNQHYTNYRIIYIDDKSPDDTGKLVQEYAKSLGKEDLIEVIINDRNVGALENIYNAIHSCKKDEIAILVDGDDKLAHQDVLKYLNVIYQDPNVWLTYGQFQWFPANIPGFAREIPAGVIENNTIREHRWLTTHLRTFYAGLFQLIKKEDLLWEDKFFPMAWDLGIMYPMIEMAAFHTRFIPDVLYIYNTANQINDSKVNLDLQGKIDTYIRHKERYQPISNFLY